MSYMIFLGREIHAFLFRKYACVMGVGVRMTPADDDPCRSHSDFD